MATNTLTFTTTWSVAADNLDLKIPVCPGYYLHSTDLDIYINWGDSNEERITQATGDARNLEHTYSAAGTYTVSVTGGWVTTGEPLGQFAFPRHRSDTAGSDRLPDNSMDRLVSIIPSKDTGTKAKRFFIHGQGDFSGCSLLQTFEAGYNKLTSGQPGAAKLQYRSGANLQYVDTFMDCTVLSVNSINKTYFGQGKKFVNVFKNVKTVYTGNRLDNSWDVRKCFDFTGLFEGSNISCPLGKWKPGALLGADVRINMSNMFANSAYNHNSIGGWPVGKVENFSGMFNGNKVFKQTAIKNWDTSNAINMSKMFKDTTSFTGSDGFGSSETARWDVSKVTDFSDMFNGSAFNANLKYWLINDTGPVNMSGMFANSSYKNTSIGDWCMTGVTDTSNMFNNNPAWNTPRTRFWERNASSDNIVDVRASTMGNVTNMSGMFKDATSFTGEKSGNISVNWNVSKVLDFSSMFENTQLNVGDALNSWTLRSGASAKLNMKNMFRNTPFNGALGSWSTNRVTDMSGMFENCPNFTASSIFSGTQNCTNMARMFKNTPALAIVENSTINSWNVAKVRDFSEMFMSSNFNGYLGQWRLGTTGNINMSNMFKNNTNQLYIPGSSKWDTSAVNNMSGMFEGCSRIGASNITNISTWDVSGVTDMSNMFKDAFIGSDHSLLNSWGNKTRNVVNFSSMFEGCNYNGSLNDWTINTTSEPLMERMFASNEVNSCIFNGDISAWDMSKVVSTKEMFKNNTTWNRLNITNWDTGSVVDMSGMFHGTTNLRTTNSTAGNLSSWNVSKVRDFTSMFEESNFDGTLSGWTLSTTPGVKMSRMFMNSGLTTSGIGSVDVTSVETMDHMFDQATSFQDPLAGWNTQVSNVTDVSYMLAGASNYANDLSDWELNSGTLESYTGFNDDGVLPVEYYPSLPTQFRLREDAPVKVTIPSGTISSESELVELLTPGLVVVADGVDVTDEVTIGMDTTFGDLDLTTLAEFPVTMTTSVTVDESTETLHTNRTVVIVSGSAKAKMVLRSASDRTASLEDRADGKLDQVEDTIVLLQGTNWSDPASDDRIRTGLDDGTVAVTQPPFNTVAHACVNIYDSTGQLVDYNPEKVVQDGAFDPNIPGTYKVTFNWSEKMQDTITYTGGTTTSGVADSNTNWFQPYEVTGTYTVQVVAAKDKLDVNTIAPVIELEKTRIVLPQTATSIAEYQYDIQNNVARATDIEDGDVKSLVKFTYNGPKTASGKNATWPPNGTQAGTWVVNASYTPKNTSRPTTTVTFRVEVKLVFGEDTYRVIDSGSPVKVPLASTNPDDLTWSNIPNAENITIIRTSSTGAGLANTVVYVNGAFTQAADLASGTVEVVSSDVPSFDANSGWSSVGNATQSGEYVVTYQWTFPSNSNATVQHTRKIKVLPGIAPTPSSGSSNVDISVDRLSTEIELKPKLSAELYPGQVQDTARVKEVKFTPASGATQTLTGALQSDGSGVPLPEPMSETHTFGVDSGIDLFNLSATRRTLTGLVNDINYNGDPRYAFTFTGAHASTAALEYMTGGVLTVQVLFYDNNYKPYSVDLNYQFDASAEQMWVIQSGEATDSQIDLREATEGTWPDDPYEFIRDSANNPVWSGMHGNSSSLTHRSYLLDDSIKPAIGLLNPAKVTSDSDHSWFASDGRLSLSDVNTFTDATHDTVLLVQFDTDGDPTSEGIERLIVLRGPGTDLTSSFADTIYSTDSSSIALEYVEQIAGNKMVVRSYTRNTTNFTNNPAYNGDALIPADHLLYDTDASTVLDLKTARFVLIFGTAQTDSITTPSTNESSSTALNDPAITSTSYSSETELITVNWGYTPNQGSVTGYNIRILNASLEVVETATAGSSDQTLTMSDTYSQGSADVVYYAEVQATVSISGGTQTTNYVRSSAITVPAVSATTTTTSLVALGDVEDLVLTHNYSTGDLVANWSAYTGPGGGVTQYNITLLDGTSSQIDSATVGSSVTTYTFSGQTVNPSSPYNRTVLVSATVASGGTTGADQQTITIQATTSTTTTTSEQTVTTVTTTQQATTTEAPSVGFDVANEDQYLTFTGGGTDDGEDAITIRTSGYWSMIPSTANRGGFNGANAEDSQNIYTVSNDGSSDDSAVRWVANSSNIDLYGIIASDDDGTSNWFKLGSISDSATGNFDGAFTLDTGASDYTVSFDVATNQTVNGATGKNIINTVYVTGPEYDPAPSGASGTSGA